MAPSRIIVDLFGAHGPELSAEPQGVRPSPRCFHQLGRYLFTDRLRYYLSELEGKSENLRAEGYEPRYKYTTPAMRNATRPAKRDNTTVAI